MGIPRLNDSELDEAMVKLCHDDWALVANICDFYLGTEVGHENEKRLARLIVDTFDKS